MTAEEMFRAQFNAFFQEKVDAAKAQGFNTGVAMERTRCTRHVEAFRDGAIGFNSLIMLITQPATDE